jgi:hypothetical protein
MSSVFKLIERKLKKKTRKHNSQNNLILKDKIKKIIKLQKKNLGSWTLNWKRPKKIVLQWMVFYYIYVMKLK